MVLFIVTFTHILASEWLRLPWRSFHVIDNGVSIGHKSLPILVRVLCCTVPSYYHLFMRQCLCYHEWSWTVVLVDYDSRISTTKTSNENCRKPSLEVAPISLTQRTRQKNRLEQQRSVTYATLKSAQCRYRLHLSALHRYWFFVNYHFHCLIN